MTPEIREVLLLLVMGGLGACIMHFIDEVKIKRAYQQGIDDATDVLSEEDDDSVPVTIKDGEPEYIVQGGFSVHKSQDVADAVCRFWTESNNERDSRNLEHHSNS